MDEVAKAYQAEKTIAVAEHFLHQVVRASETAKGKGNYETLGPIFYMDLDIIARVLRVGIGELSK